MDFFVIHPWAFGLFVVSGLGGGIGSFLFFLLFRLITQAPAEPLNSREFVFTGVLTGVVERFFFTMLIGLLGSSGIAPAILGWLAIKGQVHYSMFSKPPTGSERPTTRELSRAYLGLLATLSSLTFAVFGGYVWDKGVDGPTFCTWLASLF